MARHRETEREQDLARTARQATPEENIKEKRSLKKKKKSKKDTRKDADREAPL